MSATRRAIADLLSTSTRPSRLHGIQAVPALAVSPVIGEVVAGRELAGRHGFADRATFVAGLAEELPIETGVIQRV